MMFGMPPAKTDKRDEPVIVTFFMRLVEQAISAEVLRFSTDVANQLLNTSMNASPSAVMSQKSLRFNEMHARKCGSYLIFRGVNEI